MSFTRDWTANPRNLWPQFLDRLTGDLRFLEIGTYEGRTACFLLDRYPTAHLTVIDTFEGSPEFADLGADTDFLERFRENVEPYGDRVRVLVGPSHAMIDKVEGELDFAYIDGSHYADDVWADAMGIWPMLRSGAILAFDDYGWGCGGDDSPKPAIDRFLSEYADSLEVLHHDYQVIVRKS